MFGLGVLDWFKLGAGAALGALVAFGPVYLYGKAQGRSQAAVEAVRAANKAYKDRNDENDAVLSLDAVALCIDLGGLPDDCAARLRGVGKDQPEATDGGLPGRQ